LVFIETPNSSLSAIVYPCDINNHRQHSVISEMWHMEWQPGTRKPWLQIISVTCLERPALMLPYTGKALHSDDIFEWWVHVKDRDMWPDEFKPVL
jgi:hypothetical protein